MRRFTLALLLLLPLPAAAQSVNGLWLTQSRGAEIRLGSCADATRGPVCGWIERLLDPKGADGKPVAAETVTDARNADPSLRGRKLQGMVLLYDFRPGSAAGAFEEGTIYNAEDGKTYRANISLQSDGTLRLRGYVGAPMFGTTQVWTRLQ